MVRLFVRHAVENYATWRAGYDSTPALRAQYGVTGDAVYQSVDDPNDVTVWHDFETVEAAQAFLGATELKQAMADFGVTGTPQIWIANEA
jgi:hypothetical protein